MEKLKAQYAVSLSADMEEKTWTFQMVDENPIYHAGEFVLVPKQNSDNVHDALVRIRQAITVDPNYDINPDFQNVIDWVDESLKSVGV